jgi:hypothetical protein
VTFLADGLRASRPLSARLGVTVGLGSALHETTVRPRLWIVYVLFRAGYGAPTKFFAEKLSPVAHPLISCRHPRPHEGLSRAVLKVRAGSGACGRGLPNLDPGRHSQTSARAERNAAASGPPVGHYDPSGVLAPGDGEVLPSGLPIHGSAGREAPKIAAHVAPGDRFFSFRNGRSAPVSSCVSFFARVGVRRRWRAPSAMMTQ